jgi:hypothetical protein
VPTIIDSLIVKLGLDTAEFDKGKTKTDAGLNDLTKSALKFFAVLGGVSAIKRFSESVIESDAALGRFSKNLGASVTTVSAWSNVTEQFGGKAEGLQGTLDALSKSQTELMLTGDSGLLPYFSALGLSLADTQGKAKPVTDILLELADKFTGMDRTTANNMGRMMGIDQGTMNLLLKGRSELEMLIKRQKEMAVVSNQQAEASAKLQSEFVKSRQNFEAWGRSILLEATPAIQWFMDKFEEFGGWIKGNSEFVIDFLKVLGVSLLAIGAATMPINLTVAAILGLAVAIALLWQDYQSWQNGGDHLVPWDKWKPGIDSAKAGIAVFADFMSTAFTKVFASIDAVTALLSGDWTRFKFAAREIFGMNDNRIPDSEAPRGIRNRNPGNLEFRGQAGATQEAGGGRFAVFGTMQEGIAALEKQLESYIGSGTNTIQSIITKYAPSFENDTTGYISKVAKELGVAADKALNPSDAATMMGLMKAITNVEVGGGYLSNADIASGYKLAKGATGSMMSNSSNETHIGEINIHTQATDAKGIVDDIGHAMDYLRTSQVNSGLF